MEKHFKLAHKAKSGPTLYTGDTWNTVIQALKTKETGKVF